MDLNHLYHREQISLMRAAIATGHEARHAHRGLARGYAGRIAALRADRGAEGFRALPERTHD